MNDAALEEKVLSGEAVFCGKLINVEHWQVALPDGKTALREVVLHPGAAAIVPVDDHGMVTLVRQHRVAIGRFTWEIPAGKLDFKGEDTLAAARRELEEETGLHAREWRALSHIDTTPGFCNERIGLYLATGLTQHRAHTDADEFLNVRAFPLEEAVARVMQGEWTDAKTVAGLLLAWNVLRAQSASLPLGASPIQRAPGAFASRGE